MRRWALCSMFCLVVASFITCSFGGVLAWSNGGYSSDPNNPDYGTHDWIADEALTIQTRNVTFLTTTYYARYLLGTEAPDNPAYIGDPMNHHVYYRANGAVQDDRSADRASEMYAIAIDYLRSGNYEAAAYDIGAMTHYISDVGVFGHTMGTYTDWGAELHHSDYENFVESMTGSRATPPSGLVLGNSSAYDSTLHLARDTTFGNGTVMANIWMDANYDWSDPIFMASALASLSGSVTAVAAAINHLLTEAGVSGQTPPPSEPPSTPTSRAPQPPATLTSVLDGSVVYLAWSYPPSDGGATITGYKIYRGTAQDNPSPLKEVSSGTQSWRDGTIERGKSYFYWVVAVNSVGPSSMSPVSHVTVPSGSSAWGISVVLYAVIVAAFASGGALLWRRRSK